MKNKRKLNKAISILNIVFWCVNLVFLETSVNMLIKIISVGKSKWFDMAAKQEMTQNPLFLYRTDTIMCLIEFIMVVVVFFSCFTVFIFRKFQLRNSLCNLAIYRVLGYDKKTLIRISMQELLADMIVAFPVSVIFSLFIWSMMAKQENISFLLALMNNSIFLDILSFIICATFMVLVTYIHTKIFMERSLKKGIRYMLGQGVE